VTSSQVTHEQAGLILEWLVADAPVYVQIPGPIVDVLQFHPAHVAIQFANDEDATAFVRLLNEIRKTQQEKS
jgi:hypothetical protein